MCVLSLRNLFICSQTVDDIFIVKCYLSIGFSIVIHNIHMVNFKPELSNDLVMFYGFHKNNVMQSRNFFRALM